MIRNILFNKPIEIRSNFKTKDKSGIRDYIDVNDMAKAHYLCLKKIIKIKKNFLALNLGSKKYFSVKEIFKIVSYKINIKNQENIEIAHFNGKVHRTNKEWFPNK